MYPLWAKIMTFTTLGTAAPKFFKTWQFHPLQFIVVHRFRQGQRRSTLVLAFGWVAYVIPNIFWLRIDRQTDRQTDNRQRDRQPGSDRHADSPTNSLTDGRTDRHTDPQTGGQTDMETNKQTNRQTRDKRTDGRTDRETHRQPHRRLTDRQTRQTDGRTDKRRHGHTICPPTTPMLRDHACTQPCKKNIDIVLPRLSCKWALGSFGNCSSQKFTNQHFEVSNVPCPVHASKSDPL